MADRSNHPPGEARIDLRRQRIEQIGCRTTTFEFEDVFGRRREFIGWLLTPRARDGVKPTDLIGADAAELLAERMCAVPQIEMHTTVADECAVRLGGSRVSADVAEQVLPRAVDQFEQTLPRTGYDAPT